MFRVFPSAILVLALAATLGAAAGVRATTLYSIDTWNDVLVTLETSTGAVTEFGPSGLPFGGTVRMTSLDGRIYALHQAFTCGENYGFTPVLLSVDPVTGAGGPFVPMTSGGAPATNWGCDAIASDGQKLVFSAIAPLPTDSCGGRSKRLADLSTAGAISGLSGKVSFAADLDHLAYSPAGELYSIDNVSAAGDLYRVGLPSTYAYVGTIPTGSIHTIITGAAFTPDGQFWVVVAGDANALLRVDPSNAQVLETVPVAWPAEAGPYGPYGLTYVPMDPTPARHRTWGGLKSRYR